MSSSAEVVIIGAGVMGASVAYHLALRGCTDVTIIEKAESEVSGSTARSAAGVRHQFSNRTNILLSRYSIERLRHFDEEVGGHAELRQVGYLFLLSDAASWAAYQQQVVLQRELGVRVDLLSPADVARMLPGTRTDDLLGATYGPDDGYCDPYGIAMGYLRAAQARGTRLLRSTEATGFVRAGERVTAVQTNNGPISCGTVVNTAGPWAGQVAALAGLDVPVKPYRRTIYMTTPFPQIAGPTPLIIDVASGFYMRKEGESILMGKSNLAEPSSFQTNVDWEWLDSVLEAGLARFPFLETAGLAEQQCWAGLYEITPDSNPIMGRNPGLPNYVDASGFSGHGIMHAPATGLLMAEEILDGRAHSIVIDDLRIDRFARAGLQAEKNVI